MECVHIIVHDEIVWLISRLLAIYDKMCVRNVKMMAKKYIVVIVRIVNFKNNNLQNITLNDTIKFEHVAKMRPTIR